MRGKWWAAGVVDLLGGPNVPPSQSGGRRNGSGFRQKSIDRCCAS